MLTLTAHISTARIRRETTPDGEFLVVPVIAVREQVLNGEFLPAEELRQPIALNLWEGTPITVPTHPTMRGQHVSAGLREIQESMVIGRLHQVEFRADGARMAGEMWLDVEKARRVTRGEEALERLETAGKGAADPVEVSTGYFRSREVLDRPQTHNGNRFRAIQRNIIPDHLAILLDETGACSVEDGCGAPRVNASRPSFTGTEDEPWEAPTLEDFQGAGVFPEDEDWSGASQEDRAAVAAHFVDGTADADAFGELRFPVVNPRTGRLNRRAVANARGRAEQVGATEVRAVLDSLWDEHFAENGPEGNVDDASFGRRFVNWLKRELGENGDAGGRGDGPATHGESLAALLEDAIEQMVDAGDAEDRRDAIEQMGSAAGITPSTVGQILRATITCPPTRRLEGFADVLPVSMSEITSAAESDGCNPEPQENLMRDEQRDQVINRLADAHPVMDEEDFRLLSDEKLEALDGELQANADAGDGDGEADAGDGDGDTPQMNAAQAAEALGIPEKTLKFLRETDPDTLERVANAEAERREDLVSRLAANEDVSLPEADLKAMSLEGLETLDAKFGSGAGSKTFRRGPSKRSSGGDGGDGGKVTTHGMKPPSAEDREKATAGAGAE